MSELAPSPPALETRAALATWIVLGAGSILPRAGYGTAGYALVRGADEPFTLFDCGPGTLRALGEAGLGLERLERVVLSHFHPDHCLDLFALAFARRNPGLKAPPLELLGPRGLARLVDEPPALLARWTRFKDTTVTEVEPALEPGSLERADLRFSWVATEHTPESLAWRVDFAAGASLAYTGDTGERPQVAALARGVELFVAECSLAEGSREQRETGHKHLTAAAAARLASAAGCQRLLLTHFYPSVDPIDAAARAGGFPGAIELARDGSRHPLFGPRPTTDDAETRLSP